MLHIANGKGLAKIVSCGRTCRVPVSHPLQGSQFGVSDVEVVTATVDLDEVVSYRGAISSLQEQASTAVRVPGIPVDFNLCHGTEGALVPTSEILPHYHEPEEEIALGLFPPHFCPANMLQSTLPCIISCAAELLFLHFGFDRYQCTLQLQPLRP
jgi:hypothetical protein